MQLKLKPLKRIGSDQRGVAAVEFALIAPVAILLYCGFAELTMAMMADRRAAHTAAVVGDLVAQEISVSKTEMGDIFTVGDSIMSPFDAGALKLRITSVTADAQGVPHVQWSQGHNGMSTLKDPVSMPATLLAAGDSVIVADVQYAYTSPLKMTVPNGLTFKSTYYLKPRRSPDVKLTP
jgi:Flp pilus assembly protein TadG